MFDLRNKTARILSGMTRGALERDEALALSLLSALAGESIFLLGLPGVGKSMIARRLKLAFENATVFEYLMSRFSTPDEIFGPVSISKLKDEDRYERVTTGFLPEAEVVFLDEIWKAGPAIQNSLLTVLNEKIYLNGNREIKLPLKGIISASNELPAEGEGLEALWDRFLIRYIVNPIERKENFIRLLCPDKLTTAETDSVTFSHEEYMEIQRKSKDVGLPQKILDCIVTIREELSKKAAATDNTDDEEVDNSKFYVSDRRWKKAVNVLRVSACINGRNDVDFSDILLLTHMLWNVDSHIPDIARIISESIVQTMFHDILDTFKSSKRHATTARVETRLYSPDSVNYVIQCDGSPMKIRIADYNMMRDKPGDVFFGSETPDGDLVVRARGQYAIRFVKGGCLDINGYSYKLRTTADEQLDSSTISSISDTLNMAIRRLNSDISRNLFTTSYDMYPVLQDVVRQYMKRIDTSGK